MTLTIFHKIFPNTFHIQSEFGKYQELLCGILSVTHNIVMDLNNVMYFSCSTTNYKPPV